MSMQVSEAIREEARRLSNMAGGNPAILQAAIEQFPAHQRAALSDVLKATHKRLEVPRIFTLFPDTGPFRRELYPKQMEHFDAGRVYKYRAFMAANRVGKSESGGFEVSCHATGWYPPWWTGWRIDRPGQYIVAAKFTKTIKKVPQRKLFGRSVRGDKGKFRVRGDGMIPPDAILHDTAIFMPAAAGTLQEIEVRYRDSQVESSTIEFLSYEMGRGVFEGTEYDLAWLDEECPLDIYAEVAKRLMTTDGRMVLTWTPLDGPTEVVMQYMTPDFKPPEVAEQDIDQLIPIPPPPAVVPVSVVEQ